MVKLSVFSDKGLLLKHFNESKGKLSTSSANKFFEPKSKNFWLKGLGTVFLHSQKIRSSY